MRPRGIEPRRPAIKSRWQSHLALGACGSGTRDRTPIRWLTAIRTAIVLFRNVWSALRESNPVSLSLKRRLQSHLAQSRLRCLSISLCSRPRNRTPVCCFRGNRPTIERAWNVLVSQERIERSLSRQVFYRHPKGPPYSDPRWRCRAESSRIPFLRREGAASLGGNTGRPCRSRTHVNRVGSCCLSVRRMTYVKAERARLQPLQTALRIVPRLSLCRELNPVSTPSPLQRSVGELNPC